MSLLGKKWIIRNTDPEKKLLEKLLSNRGITQEMLDRDDAFHDPFLMKDMARAVARISEAISQKERIIIYGDYDVDGITGTTILVKTLTRLGANVSYRIPHRFHDGYGLHDKYVDECVVIEAKLIITVDCGISCAAQITRARGLGIDVIVTDHHTIPSEMPKDAYAILHPLQPDCGYPFKGLTGSAVAFKLASAMLEPPRRSAAKQLVPDSSLPASDHLAFLESLTDLASFGTVADCGPLIGENRTIVKRGLQAFKRTHWSGLRHIKRLAKIEDDKIDTTTIGFKLGPRINAAGRIDHPYVALQLLLRDPDDTRTRALAEKLENLNIRRQEMTRLAVSEAMKFHKPEYHKYLFIAHSKDWHTGILGLIAARAVNTFGCPAIILQDRGDMLVASARSIDGYNIMDILQSQAHHLITFGGHAAAAGFSVSKEKLAVVEREFYKKAYELWHASAGQQTCPLGASEHAPGSDATSGFKPQLQIDCEVAPHELTTENALLLEKMQPFGIGNEKPLLVLRDVKISEISLIGKEHNHARLTVIPKRSGSAAPVPSSISGIFFSAPERVLRRQLGDPETPIAIACNLELNRFRGKMTLQLNVVDIAIEA